MTGVNQLNYPIRHGVVTDWDDLEKILHYTYKTKLNVDPAECIVLMTEPVLTPKTMREKMAEIHFETFKVPYFYLANQGVLSIYGSSRNTGIAVEIGEGLSQVVPVYEHCSISHAARKLDIAGRDVTEWLQKILSDRGCTFAAAVDIKEKFGYVAFDYDTELQKAARTTDLTVTYLLPDGHEIEIADQRFRCAELLFKPSFNGFEVKGIDGVLFESITKCDIDLRRGLYSNIVLGGGTTMFTGVPERIEKEIVGLAPKTMKIKVVAPPHRKHAVWIGGSILASLATFPQMVITHEEYNDAGPGIVHRKCF
jgi:actin